MTAVRGEIGATEQDLAKFKDFTLWQFVMYNDNDQMTFWILSLRRG